MNNRYEMFIKYVCVFRSRRIHLLTSVACPIRSMCDSTINEILSMESNITSRHNVIRTKRKKQTKQNKNINKMNLTEADVNVCACALFHLFLIQFHQNIISFELLNQCHHFLSPENMSFCGSCLSAKLNIFADRKRINSRMYECNRQHLSSFAKMNLEWKTEPSKKTLFLLNRWLITLIIISRTMIFHNLYIFIYLFVSSVKLPKFQCTSLWKLCEKRCKSFAARKKNSKNYSNFKCEKEEEKKNDQTKRRFVCMRIECVYNEQ